MLNEFLTGLFLINSNFTLFIPYLKCDIPFYVEYSDYLYYLHCWENGVLHI